MPGRVDRGIWRLLILDHAPDHVDSENIKLKIGCGSFLGSTRCVLQAHLKRFSVLLTLFWQRNIKAAW
jgi:hypothetical protein